MYKDFYNNKLVPFINKVRMACNVGEIPLVFDNSLTYYEQLAAFSAKLNDVISTVNVQSLTLCEFMQQLTEAFTELSNDFAEKWTEISGEYEQLSETVSGQGTDITNLDLRVTALENQPEGGIGKTIDPGTFYRIGGAESPTPPEYGDYETEDNCEVLNGYSGDAANGAAGNYSNAIGYHTLAMADYSHTEGINTIAAGTDGAAAHAEGSGTIATGAAAHAEGSNTRAYGAAAHAEGAGTRATGSYSHAGGAGCTASGSMAFAHGMTSTASGNSATALGADLRASGNNQLVCGYANAERTGDYLFIVGNGATSSIRSNAFEVDKYGNVYSAALQNALNVLIDQNRAALVELVDVAGKNKLAFAEIGTNDSHGSTFTSDGVSWTLNQDGSITATRTESSATDSSCNLRIATGSLYIDDYCTGGYVLSGCPEGGSAETYAMRALHGDDYNVTDTGSGAVLSTKGSATDIYINMIYCASYTGSITFRPMVCSSAAWNISTDWIEPEIIT